MKFYERVISDFGGYEKCKDILSQPNIGFIMNAQALREHMLEYRRQHNIFEVGDKVVFIHPFELGDLFTVHSICERFIGVKRNNDESIYYAETVWGLKHANDAEIKAGKRLEVMK